MENKQNIYNNQNQYSTQMPSGQMIPPRRTARKNGGWKQRLLSGNTGRPLTIQQERTVPKWLIGKSVLVFFIALLACFAFFGHVTETDLWLTAAISVLLFFYGVESFSRSWANSGERVFLKNLFVLGLIIRLLWVLYCYFIFNPDHYGTPIGDRADVEWYMPFAKDITHWFTGESKFSLAEIIDIHGSAIDDVGYPMWLSIVYLIFGEENDVFMPFIIKCIVGAYCAICVYHIAKRHFGEGTARLTALFVALNPNMIYWCASMMKEAEMVFLCCLCVDLVDRTLSAGAKLTFKSLLPGVLVGMSLFFFRAPLAIVIFLAMFAHIVMASSRVMSTGKKIIAGVMVGVVLLVGMGDRLRTQAEDLMDTVQSDQQSGNMQWRAERKGGNSFAVYAGKTVFAPLIFTIPFPTFNQANEGQILQQQLSGGSYIKNILSFFVIIVMLMMLVSGEWRRHVFILAYTLGYLITLVLSNFAQSGRFHMPIWPFLMLFAAYGIHLAKTTPKLRRWFTMALVIEVVACLAWNWFKLAGRGMA